jgi:hypothetical protein
MVGGARSGDVGPVERQAMKSYGCRHHLVARVDHVIEEVGRIGLDLAPVPHAEPNARDTLTPLERQVLDGVRPR